MYGLNALHHNVFVVLTSTYVARATVPGKLECHILYCCTDITVHYAAGQNDAMDIEELMCEVVSQREALDANMKSFRCGLYQKCRSVLCGTSAESGTAADSWPETAVSSKSGASCSAGHCDGSSASAGAVSSSVEGMPGKDQMPQPNTFGGACQMPSRLLGQGRMGHAVPGTDAVTATTAMPKAPAKTQDKATQAGGGEAALNQIPKQSSPEMAAQGAKQARKQAKRARQRARRAQGAAVGPDSKVCSSL